MHHGHTDRVALTVQQSRMDIIIVECVKQENEANCRIDIDKD